MTSNILHEAISVTNAVLYGARSVTSNISYGAILVTSNTLYVISYKYCILWSYFTYKCNII